MKLHEKALKLISRQSRGGHVLIEQFGYDSVNMQELYNSLRIHSMHDILVLKRLKWVHYIAISHDPATRTQFNFDIRTNGKWWQQIKSDIQRPNINLNYSTNKDHFVKAFSNVNLFSDLIQDASNRMLNL